MTRTELSPSSSSSSDHYLAASASTSCSVDDRVQGAVQLLIANTGELHLQREGLRATPLRVAKAWKEATRGRKHDVRSALGGGLFQEESVNRGGGGLVLVRDIEFASTSEHSLLPFFGRCHVGYYPANGVVLGLSKAARLAKHFSQKLQSQQQFTQDLLACLLHHIQPYGAAICVVAQHLGYSHSPAMQVTTAASGAFEAAQAPSMKEFMSILQLHGCLPSSSPADLQCRQHGEQQPRQQMQPAVVGVNRVYARNGRGGTVRLPDSVPQVCALAAGDTAMRQLHMQHAVETILLELGEDLSRQGLTGSVGRYVSFMQQATAGYNQEAALAHALASAQGSAAHSSATPLLGSAPAPQLAQAHFSSLCEHHLLPFQGVLRVAVCAQHAWPALQALVQQLAACYARRLQIQERLTHEVADALMPLAQHGSVLVVCDAVHMCMVARGVEQHASSTLTVAARGRFESEVVLRSEALQQMLEPQRG